jgi:uncharacterized protein YjbJ (UPF0337 family)
VGFEDKAQNKIDEFGGKVKEAIGKGYPRREHRKK